ncbi:MAG TPA: hypothetical protein VEA38_22935 [Terriglobales bacterium]|nr:hypothetical protein [Terriglobales bacterium]
MIRTLALALVAGVVTPAFADHPGPFRSEGMSPLMTALLTAGLAFAVALIVVLVVVLLTRKRPDADPDVE